MGCRLAGTKLPEVPQKGNAGPQDVEGIEPVRNFFKRQLSPESKGSDASDNPFGLPKCLASDISTSSVNSTNDRTSDDLTEPLLDGAMETVSLPAMPRLRFRSWDSQYQTESRPSTPRAVDSENSALTCPGNSMQFAVPWMSKLNAYLSYLQYGDRHFYGNHLTRLWPSVDLDNLHVEAGSLFRQHMRDVVSALLMSCLGFLIFPFRLMVGIPFYCFVLRRTRSSDIIAARTRRHLWFLIEMTPLYLGSLLSILVLVRVCYGVSVSSGFTFSNDGFRNYQGAMRSLYALISEAEMFSPWRGFLVVVVLEVIRKQRRDMTHVVNIIRHHFFIDEAIRGEKTEVSFGPTATRHSDEDSNFVTALWLLSAFPCDNHPGQTLIDAHRQRVKVQIEQLELGTGPITEIAHSEAAMFFRSTMRDMLDQRLDTLDCTLSKMGMMRAENTNHSVVTMDFNELVEVLCAGYHNHFVEESSIMWEYRPTWRIFFVSLIYAALPSIVAAWDGTLNYRLPFTKESEKLPEVPILVPLTFFACFLNVYAVMRSIHTLGEDLEKARECFIILQRIASTHHRQRTNFEEFSSHGAAPTCTPACDDTKRQRSMTPDYSEDPTASLTACDYHGHEIRKAVRFKASIMRGADCHVNVGHMHKFDGLMRKRYGVATQTPSTTPSVFRQRSAVESGLGDGHLHSFFELDIHSQEALRMWWVMRLYVESGLLKDKVVMELLLGFTVLVLIVLVMFSISWLVLVGKLNISHWMAAWEALCLGSGVLSIFKKCARLNHILSTDSKRLTFVQHDICEEVAAFEQRRRDRMATDTVADPVVSQTSSRVCRTAEKFRDFMHVHSSAKKGGFDQRISKPARGHDHGDPGSGEHQRDSKVAFVRDGGGMPVAEDPHFEQRVTIQLLKILIDHLDRDHRPLRFVGFRIDERFLRRIYMILISLASTITVHLFAKTAVRVLGSGMIIG
eukprot:TRINITY_DN9487_c0_g3_i1.p1 TRINITY_DN9487_c0_g3~~TRINITY_DN9487_c0_g3_i1.p1  ORF type:complete len:958 (+),score=133.29 TRINITY_DN9487_c0_g3_i1:147-3020(+)